MSGILAQTLSEKAVIGTDGSEIGTLYNLTMDIESGRIEDVIVSPTDNDTNFDFETDERGRYRVPNHLVESVKDHLVIRL
ncbi:PRC-barrel domain-containing protein [Salinarchaeum sp. IM2453]|uniref:PRC-barrel domain-containing protein n=1 Tax=Salinarchaeum sp. IM2453 TaxID=2862870 RepID=UPI001C838981|nr:PRC-barrel domain-containing protein [Salinarchaeum sp. IM2453]QZA88896.1 PRC-barrel domain-containing protein [Salinarchaeum sp. IM2453]